MSTLHDSAETDWGLRRIAAGKAACNGQVSNAMSELRRLVQEANSSTELAEAIGDLAAISAAAGRIPAARRGFQRALGLSPGYAAAKQNQSRLACRFPVVPGNDRSRSSRTRIAILSLLFNWPSTGGF